MRKFCNAKNALALVMSLSILVALVSCEKANENQQPELPPVESLAMDFSDFSQKPAGAKGTAETYGNFVYSYAVVGFWNIYATLVSALPVAAYAGALEQEPANMGDGLWEWSYDFNNYKVTLEAERISNEEFEARMLVALATAPGQKVLWFDGVVRYDGTSADWTVYRDGTVAVLDIAWNKDFEQGTEDLTYTYVEANMEETGSYIMWARDTSLELDASYTVSMAAGMTDIRWNSTTLEGRVKAPLHFGDELWHCWESLENGLMDKDCS